jgi:hypothetical protein
MISFHDWLQTDVALRLGWLLLHSFWQLSLIGAVTAMLLRVFRGSGGHGYRIGHVGLLMMAIFPIAWALLVPMPTIQDDVTAIDSGGLLDRDRKTRALIADSGDMLLTTPEPSTAGHKPEPAGSMTTPPVIHKPNEDSQELVASGMTTFNRSAAQTRIVGYGRWLVPLWIAGVVTLAVRQLGGWFLARNILRGAKPIESSAIRQMVETLSARMRIARPINVLQSERVDSLGLWGRSEQPLCCQFR